jgi:hypothetical protein
MVRLLGLGILVQIAVSALLGFRLLWLARRTRLVPETAFALSFLLLGAVGYPLSIAARSGVGGPEVAGSCLALALFAQDLASIAIAVGTWRTFRPLERWPGFVVAIAAAAFGASLAGHAMTVGYTGGTDGGAWYYLGFSLRFGAFLWTCGEAFLYHDKLRRRLALELADPVVTDRIRLWAQSSLLICIGFVVFLLGRLLSSNVGESIPVLVATSLVSVASAVTMTLAFFPPAAYLEYVRRRA